MARFGDGLAVGPDLVSAAEVAVRQAVEPLGGQPPDLLCVFVSHDDPATVADAGIRAMKSAGAGTTVGCGAGGVIGDGRGVEGPWSGGRGAVAVWAAGLPGVRRRAFQLSVTPRPDGLTVDGMPPRRPDDQVAVLLADPYTFPIGEFVAERGEPTAPLPLVGGLASGLRGPGSARLFLDGKVVERGAIGVVLGGPVGARTLVSQGCRPIGPSMTVTAASNNVLLELAGLPAFQKLEEIVATLPPEDQALAMRGLHLGIAMDEYADEHERGDFLIRGVIGAERERGAIAVGSVVQVGQTVRFQVRDADAAHQELDQLVTGFTAADDPVQGALLFSCNGRGAALFPDADHDVTALRQGFGDAGSGERRPDPAIAGFFASGEIGPVAGRNYVHGFTASVLAFGRPTGLMDA